MEIINESVNMYIVIILLLIGAMIKHLKIFNNIQNGLIVAILPVIGIVLSIIVGYPITQDNVLPIITTGIVSAFVAIGVHQTGKGFANNFGIPEVITDLILEEKTVVDEDLEEDAPEINDLDENPIESNEISEIGE